MMTDSDKEFSETPTPMQESTLDKATGKVQLVPEVEDHYNWNLLLISYDGF